MWMPQSSTCFVTGQLVATRRGAKGRTLPRCLGWIDLKMRFDNQSLLDFPWFFTYRYRYVGVGKCLLLVDMDMDMDIWYLSHLCLWELMKADKQRVRSKALDGKEKRQNRTLKNLRRQNLCQKLVRCSVANFLNCAHWNSPFGCLEQD